MNTSPTGFKPEDLVEIWQESPWKMEGEELPSEISNIQKVITDWVNNNLIHNSGRNRGNASFNQRRGILTVNVANIPNDQWTSRDDFRSLEYLRALMERKLGDDTCFTKNVEGVDFTVQQDGTLILKLSAEEAVQFRTSAERSSARKNARYFQSN